MRIGVAPFLLYRDPQQDECCYPEQSDQPIADRLEGKFRVHDRYRAMAVPVPKWHGRRRKATRNVFSVRKISPNYWMEDLQWGGEPKEK